MTRKSPEAVIKALGAKVKEYREAFKYLAAQRRNFGHNTHDRALDFIDNVILKQQRMTMKIADPNGQIYVDTSDIQEYFLHHAPPKLRFIRVKNPGAAAVTVAKKIIKIAKTERGLDITRATGLPCKKRLWVLVYSPDRHAAPEPKTSLEEIREKYLGTCPRQPHAVKDEAPTRSLAEWWTFANSKS